MQTGVPDCGQEANKGREDLARTMASSRCRVSCTDSEGIFHGVEVDARASTRVRPKFGPASTRNRLAVENREDHGSGG
jgi:hypothetical protein